MNTVTAEQVVALVNKTMGLNPYAAVAAVLNATSAVLAGSTDPEACWTEDDVQQCVEAVEAADAAQ